MVKIKSYLVASHFGPTALVTAVTFLLATQLWWEGPAFVIALGIFLGQLIVGWTNDLYDFRDDLKHNRNNKPLVTGVLKPAELKRAIFIVLPIAIIFNLLGPLGLKAGSISILGIGIGVAYNFYLKPTALSPIPYALALHFCQPHSLSPPIAHHHCGYFGPVAYLVYLRTLQMF